MGKREQRRQAVTAAAARHGLTVQPQRPNLWTLHGGSDYRGLLCFRERAQLYLVERESGERTASPDLDACIRFLTVAPETLP